MGSPDPWSGYGVMDGDIGDIEVMDGIVHVMLRYVTVTYHECTLDVYTCAHRCTLLRTVCIMYSIIPLITPYTGYRYHDIGPVLSGPITHSSNLRSWDHLFWGRAQIHGLGMMVHIMLHTICYPITTCCASCV
jgi:hypothetical protein